MNDFKSLKIGIFIGEGASYSWIWFVKTFSSLDLHEIYFLDEHDVISGKLSEYDCFIIPGGDPFPMADALEKEGLDAIKDFVSSGGIYLGVCAGTYLCMKFCENAMPWLNLVEMPINNYSPHPPEAIRMKYKYLVKYRDGYVFHPVRNSLVVGNDKFSFNAPLYGGPPMVAPKENRLLDYIDFDDKTLYLIDETIARNTMLGCAAGIKVPFGEGWLYLFGPHFEHPHFNQANQFLYDILSKHTPQASGPQQPSMTELGGSELRGWLKSIKGDVSSSRVIANGMLNLRWKIGEKIWEDEKISYFLDAVWKTIRSLQKYDVLPVCDPTGLEQNAKDIHDLLSEIRSLSKRGIGTEVQAKELIEATKKLSEGLFNTYFCLKRNTWWSNGKNDRRHCEGGERLCVHTMR